MRFFVFSLTLTFLQPFSMNLLRADTAAERVAKIVETPGLVAFWDFVKREPAGTQRFVAHTPTGEDDAYALDPSNYVLHYWGEGREAMLADFPLMGRGPFGQAIRLRNEEDATFRPMLEIPRSRLHDTALDIKGAAKSVTVVVWAIRESGGHALAGIWHEGTDLKKAETVTIKKVERGQRQYALFAGLNVAGSACGHVSDNGSGTFLYQYALHKCNSLPVAPMLPGDSEASVLDASWCCFAMTLDHAKEELTGWIDGESGERWLENPEKKTGFAEACNAWRQGYFHAEPGMQPGEDTSFPADQYYNPPEETPLSVTPLPDEDGATVELRQYRYTKVKVKKKGDSVEREMVALRLNPWWYPHGIYEPANDGSGGPFTIGRVIHSSRSVGFTGWIGGVAVFDRALSAQELKTLTELARKPIKGS